MGLPGRHDSLWTFLRRIRAAHFVTPVERLLDQDDFEILAEEAADVTEFPHDENLETPEPSRTPVLLLWEAVQELLYTLQTADHLAIQTGGHPDGEEFTASYTISSGHWHSVLREIQNVNHASTLYVRPAMALDGLCRCWADGTHSWRGKSCPIHPTGVAK